MAKIVNAHADAGDRVACRVLTEAADAISETLSDVLDALDIRHEALPLVAAGSVARRSRVFWDRVCDRALSLAPNLMPIVPSQPEVIGTMLAGTRNLDGLSDRFGERLRQETAHLLS